MPICFTPAPIRRRAIPSRARFWCSAIPPVPMPTRCSAARARSALAFPVHLPTRPPSWTARRWWARPARSSRRPCANWPRSIEERSGLTDHAPGQAAGALLGGQLQRRHPGKNDLNPRAGVGLGIEVEPAAKSVGHDTVDDMQPEPGAALIATGGEERIERAAPDVERH